MNDINTPQVGQLWDVVDHLKKVWPYSGPFILLRQIKNTHTWIVLDVAKSKEESIYLNDEKIIKVYTRIL